MSRKTFLLCVGAQKAGTSWLHKELGLNPTFNFGYEKEYHYFDYLYLPSHKPKLEKLLTDRCQLISQFIKHGVRDESFRHSNFFLTKDYYFEYFSFLANQSSDTFFVGDFTPEYALLSEEQWIEILSDFDRFEFDVKILFVMRDPFERIWSACRMHKDNNPELFIDNETVLSDDEYLQRNFGRADIEKRTRYEKTIRTLDSVFKPGDIFYGFYEDIATGNLASELARFLNVDELMLRTKKRYNGRTKVSGVSKSVRQEIINYYGETYRFVSERFGAERLSKIWHSTG